MTRELEEVTRGADVADPADEAQAQQMGRPQISPPLGLGLQLFALALLLAETWQLAVPCLEGAGIRTSDLPAELYRTPMGVVLGSVFALGASASLFLFAHLALRRGLELFQAQAEPRRRLLTAGASVARAQCGGQRGLLLPRQHEADLAVNPIVLGEIECSEALLPEIRQLEDAAWPGHVRGDERE